MQVVAHHVTRIFLYSHGEVDRRWFEASKVAAAGLLPEVPVERGADLAVDEVPQLADESAEGDNGEGLLVVDGRRMLRAGLAAILRDCVPRHRRVDVLHVILTDHLPLIQEEDDRRPHGRLLLAANPAWISIPGLTEAPARPRAYYFAARMLSGPSLREVLKDLSARMLLPGDERLEPVLGGVLGQAVLHWAAETGFCDSADCSLYNAHRQEELLRAQAGWIAAWQRREKSDFPAAVAEAYCPTHRNLVKELRRSTDPPTRQPA